MLGYEALYMSQAQEVLPSQAISGIEIGKDLIMAMRTLKMRVTSNTKLIAPRAKPRAIILVQPR